MKPHKRHLVHDTDLYRDLKRAREELQDRSTRTPCGCLIFPADYVQIRLAGYRETRGASPARVAWALAHPESHLTKDDFAVHICEFSWRGDVNQCCVEPTHLRKGTRRDVRLLSLVRERQLIKSHEEFLEVMRTVDDMLRSAV